MAKDEEKKEKSEEEKKETPPPPIKKMKIISEHEYRPNTSSSVTLKEFSGARSCEGAVFLEAIPSVGLTSVIAANYIVEQLKLPLVAVVTSPAFPPRTVIDKGQPSHAVRILGDSRMVVMLCEFKIPDEALGAVCDMMYDFGRRYSFKYIVTLEGLPAENIPKGDADVLHFITSSEDAYQKLTDMGHKPVNMGVIDGATGGLLARCPYNEIDILGLLAATSKYDPGARSAANVVKTLLQLTNIEVDTAPLESKASELEDKVKNVLRKSTDNAAYRSMYG